MAIMTPPSTHTPQVGSERARTLWHAANQDFLHEGDFQQLELRSDFVPAVSAGCEVFGATVQISPIELVKRHSKEQYGLLTESIYAPARSRIEISYDAAAHLLVLYEDGVRREGETSIDGLPPSRLRNFANKLTFVPAGHSYREWHETSTPLRVTYLYLDPAKLQKPADAGTAYAPRAFFEDPILWATATKLKNLIERNQPESKVYFDALASVLAHELSRSGRELARTFAASRGGLASWQKRAVIGYIEEHLDERVSLVTLARLARLSQHHFCRTFKQSFGIPPQGYLLQRRMEQAKVLLSDRTNSITNIALTLGYAFNSSFTLAFRKITGQTPREFRRNVISEAGPPQRRSKQQQARWRQAEEDSSMTEGGLK
jgi:AraC family transcriptional regulator